MSMFWVIVIFLLFGRSLAEEDAEFVMQHKYLYKDLRYAFPMEFRCLTIAFKPFDASMFGSMYSFVEPTGNRCAALNINLTYPTVTALDPMMPFYIDKIQENIASVAETPTTSEPSKIKRRKSYCYKIRIIGSTFADYVEIFHADDKTCWNMMEIAKECSIFRQMWFLWIRRMYGVFCMDEDGCYETMELYEDDMPHCAKYIAKNQFQNASFGSWHHSIINYCQLTDMVPEAKYIHYDQSILFEDGKTEDELLAMCQFLRFRLLPEEGKEEEIREITLGEIGNADPRIERNSVAIDASGTIYIAMIMLTNVN